MLAAALFYARHGVGVFPLRGKNPFRGSNAIYDATTDPAHLEQWFDREPTPNIGLRVPIGIVVLDVDPRSGGGDQLAELEHRFGALPETLECRTGRGDGGRHLWFAYSGPVRGRIARGLDIKSNLGYVVAPPSIHPDTGRPYTWVDPQAATAPAPAWFRALLTAPAPSPARSTPLDLGDTIARLAVWVGKAEAGERNRRLYWACCRAAEQRLDPEELIGAAIAAGLPEVEARKTAASAARKAAQA